METSNETLQAYLGLMLLFPALGAFLSYAIGKKRPELSGWIATAASAASFIVALYYFFSGVLLRAPGPESARVIFEHRLFTWFAVADLKVPFLLRFDELTAVMTLVVCGVGSLIHLYSIGYMHSDPDRPRYFSYLNLFMFSMLTLVLGGNLIVLFVGWEGVGLCSYLLIGFWFKDFDFAKAGRKAFVVTRIGDAGFLIGIFLLFTSFGTVDFNELSALTRLHQGLTALYTAAALFLFFGACGKSAQIPLFIWLPDAMAGPTPVSALIHAATMVTAGVYMMARLNFLYALAPAAMLVVAVIAVTTAFVAASIALVQNDLKKILAYSTISQLGFMFLGCASGVYWVAIFHLVTHSFFKACLFLCAGSVMHGCGDEKDVQKLGGLWDKMPYTAGCYAIAGLAIAGIAPFAGFYSKNAILHALGHTGNSVLAQYAGAIVTLAMLTAVLTAFYITRSFVLTFLGAYRGSVHPHESGSPMREVLLALAVLCLIGGVTLDGPLAGYLAPVVGEVEHESRTFFALIFENWEGVLGIGLAFLFYTRLSYVPGWLVRNAKPVSNLLYAKYYLDEVYDVLIVRPLKAFADFSAAVIDRYIVDGAAHGIAAFTLASGSALRLTQSGQIRQYAGFMFGALALLVAFYVY